MWFANEEMALGFWCAMCLSIKLIAFYFLVPREKKFVSVFMFLLPNQIGFRSFDGKQTKNHRRYFSLSLSINLCETIKPFHPFANFILNGLTAHLPRHLILRAFISMIEESASRSATSSSVIHGTMKYFWQRLCAHTERTFLPMFIYCVSCERMWVCGAHRATIDRWPLAIAEVVRIFILLPFFTHPI